MNEIKEMIYNVAKEYGRKVDNRDITTISDRLYEDMLYSEMVETIKEYFNITQEEEDEKLLDD